MATVLETLNSSLKAKCEELVGVMDAADGEKSPTDEQRKGWQEQVSGLEGEIKTLRAQVDEEEGKQKTRGMAEAELARIAAPRYANTFTDPRARTDQEVKTIGQLFTGGDEFKTWLRRIAPSGQAPDVTENTRLQPSDPMQIPGNIKTIITGHSGFASPADTSGSALVVPRFRGLVDIGPNWIPETSLSIVDAVTHEQTDSDVIYYVQIDTPTVAAVPTAEATSESDTSGSKPQGALTFKQNITTAKTIAVWVPVTRQALTNAPQLRGVIDRYLTYELRRALAKEIVQGDGTGEHFLGVQSLANKLTQSFSSDIETTARKAITNLLLNGRETPNAWAMHPSDWETYDLDTDDIHRYYFGGPQDPGVPRLWGVPVLQNEFVTQGSPILGNWMRYVVADREQQSIRVSDSHASYFIRNMYAVLGEFRAAGYAERDQAFVISAMS